MATPKKVVPMCVVNIGYTISLLLPSTDGMKLIDILTRAIEVDRYYDKGYLYTIMDQPTAGFEMVKASQVRAQRGADGVLAIEDQRCS